MHGRQGLRPFANSIWSLEVGLGFGVYAKEMRTAVGWCLHGIPASLKGGVGCEADAGLQTPVQGGQL